MATNFAGNENLHSELTNSSYCIPLSAVTSNLWFDMNRSNANQDLKAMESNLVFNLRTLNETHELSTAESNACFNLNRTNANQELKADLYLNINRSDTKQELKDQFLQNIPLTPEKSQEQKKKTSFQITSVTVQRAKLSTNPSDDLYQQNLEVLNSSKSMDVDNGLSSEDTTSGSSNSSISTSSSSCSISPSTTISNITELQFLSSPSVPIKSEPLGMNSVESIVNSEIMVTIPVNAVALSESILQPEMNQQALPLITTSTTHSVASDVPMTPLSQQTQSRFKVVKLVSNEPFKRGRWTCTDFNDPPTVQHDGAKYEMSAELNSSTVISSSSSLTNALISEHGIDDFSDTSHFYVNQTYPPLPTEDLSSTVGGHKDTRPVYRIILPVGDAPQMSSVSVIPSLGVQTVHAVEGDYSLTSTFPDQSVAQEPVLSQPTKNLSDIVCNILTKELSPTQLLDISECTDQTLTGHLKQQESINIIDAPSNSQNFNSPGYAATNQTSVCHNTDGPGKALSTSVPLLEVLPKTLGVIHAVEEDDDKESALSGSSSVAIDNKIEQAMDLVKSHLMLAVREEVEVLKEKILELMDKISQLEYENEILKSCASEETLTKISIGGLRSDSEAQLTIPAQLTSYSQNPM
ncbi:uncharacterized protein LOC143222944 [Tachypleus tridentatus]|uniref:uncharacterized protein LOC143222944 n=1 Tax=Tachypleus tridentatus TaxID=6853 RepID=UPI003FD0F9CB